MIDKVSHQKRCDVPTIDPTVTPDKKLRKVIEREAKSASNRCWACGTCDNECPINLATNRLSPRKIIRLANYGLLDELLSEPEIWYCLTCFRCHEVRPNGVKPAEVIRFIREEALRRQIVKWDMLQRCKKLFGRFQRVRRHAAFHCMNGGRDSVSKDQWCDWLDTPVELSQTEITPKPVPTGRFINDIQSWAKT